ncbi:MAG: hypothetical protein BWY81_01520 [Firmicutes bacterium ADurb.Bin467]|nr:MAG: hypothetical protein BWY81_01520 [Firmicutes bacterium ADurb.Bin467]
MLMLLIISIPYYCFFYKLVFAVDCKKRFFHHNY